MGQAFTLPIAVKQALNEIREEADRAGIQAHVLAQDRIEACRAAHDNEGLKIWRHVWIDLMTQEHTNTTPGGQAASPLR